MIDHRIKSSFAKAAAAHVGLDKRFRIHFTDDEQIIVSAKLSQFRGMGQIEAQLETVMNLYEYCTQELLLDHGDSRREIMASTHYAIETAIKRPDQMKGIVDIFIRNVYTLADYFFEPDRGVTEETARTALQTIWRGLFDKPAHWFINETITQRRIESIRRAYHRLLLDQAMEALVDACSEGSLSDSYVTTAFGQFPSAVLTPQILVWKYVFHMYRTDRSDEFHHKIKSAGFKLSFDLMTAIANVCTDRWVDPCENGDPTFMTLDAVAPRQVRFDRIDTTTTVAQYIVDLAREEYGRLRGLQSSIQLPAPRVK